MGRRRLPAEINGRQQSALFDLRGGRRHTGEMDEKEVRQMATDTQDKPLTAKDVRRLFDNGYREVEILEDGRVREASRNGHDPEETVTRTLKTKRTWY